jgi:hypothetical protein
MLDHTDPALGAVSRNVNERATGPTMTRQEGLALIDDVELDEGDDDSEEADGRRLTDHYDERQIPDSYDPEEGTTDGPTNREKLLAGETVEV